MPSVYSPLIQLLQHRADLNFKIQKELREHPIPGLSPIQHILLLTIIGLISENNQPPTASELLRLISMGSTREALFVHITALRRKGLVLLRHAGGSESPIFATKAAYSLLGIPNCPTVEVLNPTTAQALAFIRGYVGTHHKFPTHLEINRYLGRPYGSAGDVLNNLLKNNFLTHDDGKWRLTSKSDSI